MENRYVSKCVIIVIGMLLIIMAFVMVLIALKSLPDFFQIILLASLFLTFCFLGAKLLTTMTMTYTKVDDKHTLQTNSLVEHRCKYSSEIDVVESLKSNGFHEIIIDSITIKAKVILLQKIQKEVGANISEILIFNNSLDLYDKKEIDSIVFKLTSASSNRNNIIRQRNTILCYLTDKFDRDKAVKFVKNLNYSFGVIIPMAM